MWQNMTKASLLVLAVGACGGADGGSGSTGSGTPQLGYEQVATLSVSDHGTVGANGVADFLGDGSHVLVYDGCAVPFPSATLVPFKAIRISRSGALSNVTDAMFGGQTPSAVCARRMIVTDLNGDQIPDIFSANHGYDVPGSPGERQTLLLSSGNGTFTDASSSLPALNDFAHSAAAGDVRRAGVKDIIVGQLSTTKNLAVPDIYKGPNTFSYIDASGQEVTEVGPYMLRGGSGGTFTYDNHSLAIRLAFPWDKSTSPWRPFSTPGFFTSSLFVDVNGDGWPDLVVGAEATSTVAGAVFLNDGTGQFPSTSCLLPVGMFGSQNTGSVDVATIDLNGDGRPDLLLSETPNHPFYGGGGIQVLINDGNCSFHDETASRIPGQTGAAVWVQFILFADMNRDGRTDIVLQVATPNEADPVIWINQGGGFFSPLARSSMPPFPYGSLTPVDYDGDGIPDLLSFVGGAALTITLFKGVIR